MDQNQINFMNLSFEPFHSCTSRSFRDVHISSNPRFLYSTRVSQPNHFHSLFQLDISKLICTWKSLPNLLLLLFRGQCWIHCLRGVYGPIRKPKFFHGVCQEFEKTNQTSNYCVKEAKPCAFNLKKNTDYKH